MAKTKPTTSKAATQPRKPTKAAVAKANAENFKKKQRLYAAQIMLEEGGLFDRLDQEDYGSEDAQPALLLKYLSDLTNNYDTTDHNGDGASIFNYIATAHLGFPVEQIVPLDLDFETDSDSLDILISWNTHNSESKQSRPEQIQEVVKFLYPRSNNREQEFLDLIDECGYRVDATDYMRLNAALYSKTKFNIGSFHRLVTAQELEKLAEAYSVSYFLVRTEPLFPSLVQEF